MVGLPHDTSCNVFTDSYRMTKVSDAFTWEEMCELTEEDMDNLLKFYEPGTVPELDTLKAMRGGNMSPEDIDVFDGSFGFSLGF